MPPVLVAPENSGKGLVVILNRRWKHKVCYFEVGSQQSRAGPSAAGNLQACEHLEGSCQGCFDSMAGLWVVFSPWDCL